MKRYLPLLLCLVLCSCHPRSCELEPCIKYTPQRYQIHQLSSAFSPLSPEEQNQDWGREYTIALSFAHDFDLYRAITGFKRALILIPRTNWDRRLQIEYSIVFSYYLGNKYCEAAEAFELSGLPQASGSFPAFGELLLILYDSYQYIGETEKAFSILELIEKHHPDTANNLKLQTAFHEGDLCLINALAPKRNSPDDIYQFLDCYCYETKSVTKAQTLNAVLPGAGYYYVGQKKSALTSFIINTLFIGAAYHFFEHGNTAAGLITTSLEAGWYFGGINGAGLAAKEYNEGLYNRTAKETMIRNDLFPVLMFETAF